MIDTTLLYAGILGVIMAILSIRVPIRRGVLDVPWGDGEDERLSTRIRVFGNFIEYVPAILILMALLELSEFCGTKLHAAGIALVFARVVHAVSLKAGELPMWRKIGRAIGAMTTWLVLLALSIAALLQLYG